MTETNDKKAIIIFAKYPVEGKVKTRLAKSLTDKFAAEFYRKCSEYTFKEAEKVSVQLNCEVFLFASAKDEIEKMKEWAGYNFHYEYQQGTDLGDRMYNAFGKVFGRNYNNVIIIGTDAPDINSELIKTAFEKLNGSDVVIGPSNDGGYYLLGLKQLIAALFKGISWSTGKVLPETIEKLKAGGNSFSLLEELTDIDTIEDLQSWTARVTHHNPLVRLVKKELARKDFLP